MNRFFYLFGWIILLTVINSCSTLQNTRQEAQPDLLSGKWEMVRWKDKVDLKAAFPTGVPNFEIDSDKGSMSGFNGCNQITAKLRHNRQMASIQFFAISSTKIFCNTVPELELTNSLTRVNQYRVDDGNLTLLFNKEVIMEFKRTKKN